MQPLDRCFFSPLKKYFANEKEEEAQSRVKLKLKFRNNIMLEPFCTFNTNTFVYTILIYALPEYYRIIASQCSNPD